MRSRWLLTSLVLAIGAFLRIWQLGSPKELVFDEIYYVDGAKDLLASGVERSGEAAEFIVHPPIGKWLIALGIKIFGDEPFGWRIAAALFGTLSIALIYLIARRLFNSDSIALLAAVLTVLDGLHLVMSRTALLDIFLTFFLLAAFLAFLYHRHWLAPIMLGFALATKWNAAYLIIALGCYLIFHNRKVIWRYLLLIPIVYIISWAGWFISDQGWGRNESSNPLSSFINYHREILNFHSNLNTDHPYEASPWNWLILGRPTSFYYQSPQGCGAENCSQEILAIGTPVLWWIGLIAICVTFGFFIAQREHIAGLILLGLAANYLPWFLFPQRTTFFFYAITLQPFMILAICYVTYRYLADPNTRARRKQNVLASLAVIAVVFLYFLPLFLGTVLTYQDWYSRMWLPSWI